MKCKSCGARIFGKKLCIICKKPFSKRHPAQITCASKECKKTRQLQIQKLWVEAQRTKTDRFPNEFVICMICGAEVKKIRSNQSTCLSIKCQRTRSNTTKFKGIKAEYVYRNLGQV